MYPYQTQITIKLLFSEMKHHLRVMILLCIASCTEHQETDKARHGGAITAHSLTLLSYVESHCTLHTAHYTRVLMRLC